MKSSGRKALKPKNIFLVPPPLDTQVLKKPIAPSVPLPVSQSIDASLAEELRTFKKKLENLRNDQERTEKLLQDRDEAMDLQLNHLFQRAEIQKSLEIQVDRLFRLKELHAYSSKISQIRSLRAKEQEKWKRLSLEPVTVAVAASDAKEPPQESSDERIDRNQ